jgi:hypothetical protein
VCSSDLDFKKGKLYLDSLSVYYNKLPEKDYFILNAQSLYYDLTDEPEKALEKEKKKLLTYNLQEESVQLSRLYYNISYESALKTLFFQIAEKSDFAGQF